MRVDLRLTLVAALLGLASPLTRRHVRQRPPDRRRRPAAPVDGRLDRVPGRARARPRRLPLPQVDRPPGRSLSLRRPRERGPAVRPARERPSGRHRPVARGHPLLAVRDVRPRALPEAGPEPPLGPRLELRDRGTRRPDHRPHGLRRGGRRRRGAVRNDRRLLGVRAGAGPPALARGPEAAPRGGAPVLRRGSGRAARRGAIRLERDDASRPGRAGRPLEAGRRLGQGDAPHDRRGPRLRPDARRPAARPRRAAADGVPLGRRGVGGEGRGRDGRGLPREGHGARAAEHEGLAPRRSKDARDGLPRARLLRRTRREDAHPLPGGPARAGKALEERPPRRVRGQAASSATRTRSSRTAARGASSTRSGGARGAT